MSRRKSSPSTAGRAVSASSPPRVAAAAPTDVDRTAAEERIFEAALAVFARKGRDGARMQQIADAAAINKAMLHYYFRSKDRLYAQVFRYVLQRFDRAFFEAVEKAGEASFGAALEAFVDHYITFMDQNQSVLRLMVNEFLAGGEVIRAELKSLAATGSAPPQRFVRLVARGIETGEITAVDPRHFLVTLVSGCLFPFICLPMIETIFPDATSDYQHFLADRKRNLLAVLRQGIEPRHLSGPRSTRGARR